MKSSLKMLIALAIISLQALSSMAQSANKITGIYMSEHDYKLHRLSYVLNKNDKLQLNEFLDGKNISLLYQDKKINLAKNEIYGYRLHNQDYRFFNNEAYTIVDTAGFMLYERQKLTQQGKGYLPVERYFFSAGTAQPVLELTIENLWNSFPKQTGFRYSLQNNFKQDADLMTFDKPSAQYKIKYLYFQQKQVMAHVL